VLDSKHRRNSFLVYLASLFQLLVLLSVEWHWRWLLRLCKERSWPFWGYTLQLPGEVKEALSEGSRSFRRDSNRLPPEYTCSVTAECRSRVVSPPDSYSNSSCSNLGSDIDYLVKGSSFYPVHPSRFRDVNV